MKPKSSYDFSISIRSWISFNGHERQFIFLSQCFASFPFEQQGPAGLQGEHGNSGGGANLHRAGADAGNVEPHVVVQFGHFDGDRAAILAGQFAAAREAFVRALKPFHRQHRAVFHDDGLADFQTRNFLRDAKTKLHVRALLVGQWGAEMKSRSRA